MTQNIAAIFDDIHKIQLDNPCRDTSAASCSSDCTIIAVSKTRSPVDIRPLIMAGHRDFGENYVQEALQKWPALKAEFPNVRLHCIGALQSNKVREAMEIFDVFHCIDRAKIAEKISVEAVRLCKKVDGFVQVNISCEPQKAGVSVQDLPELLGYCRTLDGLTITGLMGIPPAFEGVSSQSAPYFAHLAKLASDHGLKYLSMGMSADYKQAAAMGATHIRLGTILFGERNAL